MGRRCGLLTLVTIILLVGLIAGTSLTGETRPLAAEGSISLPDLPETEGQLPSGTCVLYVGKFPHPISVGNVGSQLAVQHVPIDVISKGECVSWKQAIDKAEVHVFSTENLFWISTCIEQVEGAKTFLNDLIRTLAVEYRLPPPQDCQITDRITIPIVHPDGTIDMSGMQVRRSPVSEYYRLVLKSEVTDRYGVSDSDISMEMSNGQLYWLVETGDGVERVKAMTLHYEADGDSKAEEDVPEDSLTSLPYSLPQSNPDPTQTDYVIMYKSSLTGWGSVIAALYAKYSGDYQDLKFTTKVSEKLSDLQTIEPKCVIIVIDPADGNPDFFDDIDSTMCDIDDDEFQDAVWTVITGFDASTALALVNAPNASDDHTLIIANPDGSLLSAGYRGLYLASMISDDDTHLGTATHYVNETDANDNDCTAENLQDEINNDNKDCVLFLDHGTPGTWHLRDNHSIIGGIPAGAEQDLQTLNRIIWDAYSIDNNNRNSFIYASACLTSRIHGERDANWSPWEYPQYNFTGSWPTSVALAWMEDSPGFYIGADSVNFGAHHIMIVLLNMMKFGYSPAEALMISKNVYHYIIEDETTEDNPDNGDVDDLLLFLERQWLGLGDPSWNISIAGNPPDYAIDYTGKTQQDQLPDNERGYVYVDTDVNWQSTIALAFNEELVCELANLFGEELPYEEESPFTLIPVENAGANYQGIWSEDQCAVIAGIFKPTSDTKSIDFCSGNPSDPDWHLYDHAWYGTGTTNAYEIFKCKKNTDELVWIVGAGVTDADSDSSYEWRINDGYSKSFGVDYYVPGVGQSVGLEVVVDTYTRQKAVTLENNGSQTAAYVIAKVPILSNAHTFSVSPGEGITYITTTSDAGQDYCEFTIASLAAGETKNLTLQYDVGSDDTTPPTVVSTSPEGDATDVAITTAVSATFSEAMNEATITTTSFSLSYGGAVAGTVSYDPGTSTATFTPHDNLDCNTVYTANITTAVTDVAANHLAANHVWSFTTSAAPLVTTNDATDVTTTLATLNGTLDDLGLASSVEVYFEWGTTTAYGSETPVQTMDTTGPFNADLTGLAPGTTYHFKAKAVGDGISYGQDSTFTTKPTLPWNIPGEGQPSQDPTEGCFIATAAYGSPMAEEIEILREFRDEYLLTNPVGEALVEFYYKVSPPMAEFITEHPTLKPVIRAGLVPAIAISTVAVNTTLTQKLAILSGLALVSIALGMWARQRSRRLGRS